MNEAHTHPETSSIDAQRAIKSAIASYRRLTGGRGVRDTDRRAVIACSGGADSAAAAIALSRLYPKPLIVHVLHDMRPREDAAADLERTRILASELGCPFEHTEVRVATTQGNTERNARDARYGALARISNNHGIENLVTGHHADDQLETLLMRFVRGAGIRGMSGIAETRPLTDRVTLVRPLLALTRTQCEAVCTAAGYTWAHDDTNDDTTRIRARLRADVLPALLDLNPSLASQSVTNARSARAASDALTVLAKNTLWDNAKYEDNTRVLSRDLLRTAPDGVIEPLVRLAVDELADVLGHDRISADQVIALTDAINDPSTERRTFTLGPILTEVHASRVTFSKKDHP